jgi:hypothetical protein
MTLMATSTEFLFDAVRTDGLVAGVDETTGPVARTCNCAGTCGPGLCHGSCCSEHPIFTILEI